MHVSVEATLRPQTKRLHDLARLGFGRLWLAI
jgi:hypothetical protein